MSQSTTIIAFDQHAATTVAAVLLSNQRTPALHSLTSDHADNPSFRRSPASPGAGALLLRSRPLRLRVPAHPHHARRVLRRHRPCPDSTSPGDRIKTDRRDASQLAVLSRAGALTAIHIPTEHEDAARYLLRCREDIRADLLRARHRFSKFLLRHGRRFTDDEKSLVETPRRLVPCPALAAPALDQTYRAYLRAVDEAVSRLQRHRCRLPRLTHHPAVPGSRRTPALFPRHRRSHCPHHRRQSRRPTPLPLRPEPHGLRRVRPLGVF